MQFSTKAAALQPHQEGALLYICRNRENAPDNETARLLLESLAEGERFAAADLRKEEIQNILAKLRQRLSLPSYHPFPYLRQAINPSGVFAIFVSSTV